MLASRLAALAALSLMSIAPATAQLSTAPAERVIQVWSFGFAPQPILLTSGRSVTLAFVNQSGSSHDFTAKEFFANSTITAGAAPGGEIDLGPHQTRTITLIPRAGSYKAHCSHFLHEAMGMHDQIIVN